MSGEEWGCWRGGAMGKEDSSYVAAMCANLVVESDKGNKREKAQRS